MSTEPTAADGLSADALALCDYLRKIRAELEARRAHPQAVMCGCADWLSCEHPWPCLLDWPNV